MIRFYCYVKDCLHKGLYIFEVNSICLVNPTEGVILCAGYEIKQAHLSVYTPSGDDTTVRSGDYTKFPIWTGLPG